MTTQDSFEDIPEHASPIAVGETVTVEGRYLATRNDVGGTTMLPAGRYECEVTKAFWDYECGWRYHGKLVDEGAVENVRELATSGYDAEYYRQKYPNNQQLAEDVQKAAAQFDPSRIYFSEFDLVPTPSPAP